MIRFEHENVRAAYAFDHQIGHVSKVSDKSDLARRRVNQKSDRVLRIMRNGECVHLQIGDFEARSRFKQVAVELVFQLKFKRLLRRAIAVNRDIQLLRDAGEPVNMVTVFMGDQNRGEILRGTSNAGKTLADLTRTEPRINKDACFIGLNIGAVAGRTAAEDGEFDGHVWTLAARQCRGNFFQLLPERYDNEFAVDESARFWTPAVLCRFLKILHIDKRRWAAAVQDAGASADINSDSQIHSLFQNLASIRQ